MWVCVPNIFIIIYFLAIWNLWVIGNYEKNSRWALMNNITIRLLWVLVTNNYMLLLSWISYIIPIITPFLISIFLLLYIFRYSQFYYLSFPHIFLQVIFVLRKSNRGSFLNLREWKCIHYKGWCYSLILRGCLAKKTNCTEFYSEWHKSTFKENAFATWFYSIVRLF